MTQETAESKILKARVRLLLNQPFFGNLLLYLEPVEKKGMAMPTMATDGDHLFYDPDYVMSLPMEHLIGVMLHEIGHIAPARLEVVLQRRTFPRPSGLRQHHIPPGLSVLRDAVYLDEIGSQLLIATLY